MIARREPQVETGLKLEVELELQVELGGGSNPEEGGPGGALGSLGRVMSAQTVMLQVRESTQYINVARM